MTRGKKMILLAAVVGCFGAMIDNSIAQTSNDELAERLRKLDSGIARIRGEIDKYQSATNCQKAPGEQLGFELAQGLTIRIYSSPDESARSLELDLEKGTTVYRSGLAADGGFECVLIGAAKVPGWLKAEDFSKLQAIVTEDRPLNANLSAIAECSRGLENARNVVASLEMFTRELNGYQGCSSKPELSYLISYDNQQEIEERLTQYLVKAQGPTCSRQIGSFLTALGEKLEATRKRFPSCGQRSKWAAEYVTTADLNVRDFWIEAVSAKIIGVVGEGARVQLLDKIGKWGYFKTPLKQGNPPRKEAVLGWMNMGYVRPRE